MLIPYYTGNDPLKSKVAAAMMPGFLLYGGFTFLFTCQLEAKCPIPQILSD
ncbi:hypothetical protein [Streptococcus equi]|uniref:hypothetical protein n=1 Tax=Streptococcus equi TaxID=1336 RepID=UPI0039C6F682